MKSRIHHNLDGAADMGTYFEMPLRQFVSQMPQYANLIANTPVDFNDPKYIVRFRFKNGNIKLEIGYPEDAEWKIGQPDKSGELIYPSKHEEIEKLLDEEIARGGLFVTLLMREYIEKYPKTEKLFKNIDIDSRAVCFYRNDNNEVRMIIGNKDNREADWKKIIQGFNQK